MRLDKVSCISNIIPGVVEMPKYRKKPVLIEAFKFYVDPMPDWFMDKVSSNDVILYSCNYPSFTIDEAYCEIKTLEGTMIANGGDFIIKGVQGEIYPCKSDIFELTYEQVND
jgi:hypothetical protein